MTLKYGKGHQTWNELQDPERGYNQAKFERPPLNSVHQNAKVKLFVKSETSITSLKYVQK